MFYPGVNTDPQLGVTPAPSEFTQSPHCPLIFLIEDLAMRGEDNKYLSLGFAGGHALDEAGKHLAITRERFVRKLHHQDRLRGLCSSSRRTLNK